MVVWACAWGPARNNSSRQVSAEFDDFMANSSSLPIMLNSLAMHVRLKPAMAFAGVRTF